ncbi:MAG: histidine kinase [Bacteroidota bacterium]
MPKNWTRFIYMIIVGIGISFLLHYISVPVNGPGIQFIDFLMSIIITIIIWEGNLRLDHFLNARFSWVSSPCKRIMVQLPVTIIYTAVIMYVSMLAFNMYVCKLPLESKNAFMSTSLIIGVMIAIILLSIEIGHQFFGHWKASLVEIEHHKTQVMQAQLQNLKSQINPHFLFNNMSVLSSLVYKDQDKAVDFINQLSKVYRYLLDNKDNELVSLNEELAFIRSYTYLLQIRFDTNITFEINIPDEAKRKLLPPMALQILVENAIKHNEISEAQPLNVSIKTENDWLEVSNNLQLRSQSEPSCKTGLNNIRDRYSYFTEKLIDITEDAKSFHVKIPLLQAK